MRTTNLLLVGLVLVLAGCSTTTPNLVHAAVPSPGPNGLHSGVYAVQYASDGSIGGHLWYPQNEVKYNALIKRYGTQFTPPLTPDWHLSTTYVETGWVLAASGKLRTPVIPGPGFWEADPIAINDYIQLLSIPAQETPQKP
jgi:hypothetical protein